MTPYQMSLPEIPAPEDDIMDHAFRQAFDQYGYLPWTNGEIGHDLSTLNPRTVNPRNLHKSISDSGYNPSTKPDIDIEALHRQWNELQNQASTGVGQVTSGNTEVFRHQWSELQSQSSIGGGAGQVTSGNTEVHLRQRGEMRSQTSTGGGAGRVTSGNEAPEEDPTLKLLQSLNSTIEAFRECNGRPKGLEVARQCAQLVAFQVPENVLQVFAEAYQDKVRSEGGTQAHNPSRRAKSKEEERE